MSSPKPGAPERIVLLATRPAKHAELRAMLARIDSQCLVEIAPSQTDAALLTSQQPLELLVLDLAFEPQLTRSLLQHIARFRPHTNVLIFDDEPRRLKGVDHEIRPWAEAEAALLATLAAAAHTAAAAASVALGEEGADV